MYANFINDLRRGVAMFAILAFFCFPQLLLAAMTSTDYEIYADSVSTGGADLVTTSTYSLSGISGEIAIASSTDAGNTFELRGGFEAEEKGILAASIDVSSISLGTLSSSSVAVATTTLSVSTDSETGYTAAISEDGNLRSGANDINDVADGTVTTGTEEYGIKTTGSDGLLTTDTAIAGSVNVASALGTVTNNQTVIYFRASIASSTVNGTYSHAVTVTITANP